MESQSSISTARSDSNPKKIKDMTPEEFSAYKVQKQ